MWWIIGVVIAGIIGIAQKILEELQQEVAIERKRWEDSYQATQQEVKRKQQEIENTLRTNRDRLQYAKVKELHSASHRLGQTTHSLLQDAQKTLDAMGRTIVKTAQQRRIIEQRKRNSFFGRGEMEKQILGLHKLRDKILIPDKDKVKAQRNNLREERNRLNKQTAELRDLKAAILHRDRTLRLEERNKWREKPCKKGCGRKVRYKSEWNNPPNYCKPCAEKQKLEWKPKNCSKCGGKFHYHVDWKRIPSLCKNCKPVKTRRRS